MVEIAEVFKGLFGLVRNPRFARVLTPALGFALVWNVALADTGDGLWNDYLHRAAKCEAALNGTGSAGTRCLLGNSLEFLLDNGLERADAYGKQAFGQHFQVVGDLDTLPGSDEFGIQGDIDVVLPFANAGSSLHRQGVSSLFFQHGVSRWKNNVDSGPLRNDLRQGMVTRFRLSGAPGASIVGVSAFHLVNAEYGHRVLVPGFDYTGRWGTGSVHYFLPTTGWRPGARGTEERALEGVEVGMRLDLTTTLSFNTVGYRWQSEDGTDRWDAGARLDLDWRPHPWLKLGAGYDGIGRAERFAKFQVALQIPLGSPSKRPQWEGLGAFSFGSGPALGDLWSPVSKVDRIRVATRAPVSATADGVEVRFLDDSAGTGGEVRLEVSLSAPAAEDVRVEVQLVPGSGDNPAVPGVDFVDEPVEVTIRQGTKSSTVSIQLLPNDDLQESRSLNVTATIVS